MSGPLRAADDPLPSRNAPLALTAHLLRRWAASFRSLSLGITPLTTVSYSLSLPDSRADAIVLRYSGLGPLAFGHGTRPDRPLGRTGQRHGGEVAAVATRPRVRLKNTERATQVVAGTGRVYNMAKRDTRYRRIRK